MADPIISIPWMDESMTVLDFNKVKVNGELAVDILEQRDRYQHALERLSRKAPIGDYVADLYSDLCNPLLIEELDQRADYAREALGNPESVNARA